MLTRSQLACYYKRNLVGDFIGYKRDASGVEIRCGGEEEE
jgi:hypothetical protein